MPTRSRLTEGPLLDPRRPFYPLVVSYLTQLLSFRELVIRGTVGRHAFRKSMTELLRPYAEGQADPAAGKTPEKLIEAMLGPLILHSEGRRRAIVLDPDVLARELSGRVRYHGRFMRLSAATLLILAHEVCKDQPFYDHGPLWEFLRHCRNGIAHNGHFHLTPREPRQPAEWRALKIERALQGVPVFKQDDGRGLLSLADPVHLLADIEDAYPTIPQRDLLRDFE